jgi:hypothetical protein
MDTIMINVSKLHEELKAAGLPVVSVHSTGAMDYSRPLTPAEKITVDQLIAAHDPVVIPKPTTDQLIRALWKKVMLGDSSDADKILQIME